MMKKGLAIVLFFVAGACAKTPGYSDGAGLIRFSVPESWELKSEEHGMRFAPVGKQERTVLMVKADPLEPNRTVAEQREIRLAQARQQGMDVIVDQTTAQHGFQVWENHVESEARGVTMHTFHLFGDKAQVEVKLMVEKANYAAYRDDLVAVVDSVRAD